MEQDSTLGHLKKFHFISDNKVRKLSFAGFYSKKTTFTVAFAKSERISTKVCKFCRRTEKALVIKSNSNQNPTGVVRFDLILT